MSQNWTELWNAHAQVLKDHLRLWVSLKELESSNPQVHNVVSSCMERTQEMIRNLDSLSTLMGDLNGHKSQEPTISHQPPKKEDAVRRKRSHSSDSREPGGLQEAFEPLGRKRLFVMDSKPSSVDALLNHFANGHKYPTRTKRPSYSMPRPDIEPLGSSLETNKVAPDPTQESKGNKEIPDTASEIPSTASLAQTVVHEDEDSFLAKVNKRQQEKEEKRKKKDDKKRKRESNGSVEDHETQRRGRPNKKQRQKLKQANDANAASTNNGVDLSQQAGQKRGNSTTRQPDKRQKTA